MVCPQAGSTCLIQVCGSFPKQQLIEISKTHEHGAVMQCIQTHRADTWQSQKTLCWSKWITTYVYIWCVI